MSNLIHNKPALSADWTPSDKDVVVGKGKKFYLHKGNVMLRTLVASMLGEYSKATTKAGKSDIISSVVKHVNASGSFVRRDLATGKWVYAEDRLCREKCSQTFRDALHDIYRSSSVAKKNKRRREQEETEMSSQPSAPSSMNTEGHSESVKRIKLMEPTTITHVFPPLIPSALFETDMVFSAPSKFSCLSPPKEEKNLVSILSDLLALPGDEDENSNPFEPTPLLPGANDIMDSSLALDFFDDDLFQTDAPAPIVNTSNECFRPFNFDSTPSAADFQPKHRPVVSPNFAAAYAA